MRRLLSLVMAKHIGQMMTPELAVSIAKDLLLVAEKPIDISQFEPRDYKHYVLAFERIEDILPELHPLHEYQYAETEVHRAGIPMNPDYEEMIDRERAGKLIQFTARLKETGELVGHMRAYLNNSAHTQTLMATEDTFFLKKEHRGGFLAVRLWQYADRCAEKIGVRETRFSSKLMNNADSMAKYLKYQPVAVEFVKVI